MAATRFWHAGVAESDPWPSCRRSWDLAGRIHCRTSRNSRPCCAGLVDAIARRRADGSLRIQPIVRPAGVEVDVTADQVDPSGSASELALEVSSVDGSSGQAENIRTRRRRGIGTYCCQTSGAGHTESAPRTLQTNWRGEAALALAPPREFASLTRRLGHALGHRTVRRWRSETPPRNPVGGGSNYGSRRPSSDCCLSC